MGGQGSKPAGQVTTMEHVNHPKFNDVNVVRINEQDYMQMQMPVHSEKEVNEWKESQKRLDTVNRENLLLPHTFEFKKEGLCGSTGIVKILYENYPYLLTDEIYNRKSLNKPFDESQIWYLLYTCVTAAKDFERQKIKLGDIRPQNIFINEEGQVKLANIWSWPNEDNNYMKTVLNNETTYLAPEEIAELQTSKHDSGCNPNLAQAFSIGMTIIDAGLLGDSSRLYNVKSQKFDLDAAKQQFRQWQESNYSDFLKKTVLSMCDLEPKNRATPSDVFNKLQPYENDIKELRDFASSMQNSPNRTTQSNFNETGQYKPVSYQYDGPVLVKSQLVPERTAHQSTSYEPYKPTQPPASYNLPPSTYGVPSTTTYTRFTGPITSLPTGVGSVPAGSTGHYSYTETTSTTNNVPPYSLPYQPATRIISQSPVGATTIPPLTKYEFSTSGANISGGTNQNPSYTSNLPPISSYTGPSISSGTTNIYTTGLPSGLTAGSSFPSGATYGQSYFTTTSTATGGDPASLLSRQAPVYSYTNTTTQNQQNTTTNNAGSGDANVAATSGSNAGNVQSVSSSAVNNFQSGGSAASGTNIYPTANTGATNFQGSASGAGTYQSSGTSNTGMFQNPTFQSGLTNLVAPNPTIKSFTNMVSTSGDGQTTTGTSKNVTSYTITRIVNGQPVTSEVGSYVRKDLTDAREVTSIVPPKQP